MDVIVAKIIQFPGNNKPINKDINNDNKLYNLNELKDSKLLVEHLEAILTVVNLTMRSLSIFEVYQPVARILYVMREEQRILVAHLAKNKSISENKGITNE